MAGLLPSEGKLRGSPANILGRCTRGKIGRAFLFSERGACHDFSPQNFTHFITDQTHRAAQLVHKQRRARCARSPQFMRVFVMKRGTNTRDHATHHHARRIIERAQKIFAARYVERRRNASQHIVRAKNFIAAR